MNRSRFVRIAFCCVALLGSFPAVVAHADPARSSLGKEPEDPIDRARLHFKLGVDFYRERNFRAALIEFERAYQASPHYKLLYNLGQASLELQEDSNAIGYFNRYLAEGEREIPDERKTEVSQTIVRLQARLATITVTTNQPGAEIYVDQTRIGISPLKASVKVSVGRHKFVAIKSGFSDAERVIDVAAGDSTALELEFKDPPQIDVSSLQRAENALARREETPMSPAVWTGIATGALGVAAGSLSILTMVAQGDYDDQKKLQTTRSELDRMRDDAKTKALIADVLWGATIIGAGVTVVLMITSGGSDQERDGEATNVAFRVNPTGVGVTGEF
jgi:tetratricopeptide (TPR) repeat protein